MNNYVFIDGQNLYLGISTGGWKMDLRRFRVYLKEKYFASKAFYFIGYKTKYLKIGFIKYYFQIKNLHHPYTKI